MDPWEKFMNYLREGKAADLGLSIRVLCSRGRVFGLRGVPEKIHFEVEHIDTTNRTDISQGAPEVAIYTASYVFDPIKNTMEELHEQRRPGGLYMRDCETPDEWLHSFFFYVDHEAGCSGTSRVEAQGLFETFDAATLEEAERRVRMDLACIDFSTTFHPGKKCDVDLRSLKADKSKAMIRAALRFLRRAWMESESFKE